MKVEISEEGVVLCNMKPCIGWRSIESTCNNCPIDKMFDKLIEYQVSLADNRNENDYEKYINFN